MLAAERDKENPFFKRDIVTYANLNTSCALIRLFSTAQGGEGLIKPIADTEAAALLINTSADHYDLCSTMNPHPSAWRAENNNPSGRGEETLLILR